MHPQISVEQQAPLLLLHNFTNHPHDRHSPILTMYKVIDVHDGLHQRFFSDLIVGQSEDSDRSKNQDAVDDNPVDNDASGFLSQTVGETLGTSIFGLSEHCPEDDRDTIITNNTTENDSNFQKYASL